MLFRWRSHACPGSPPLDLGHSRIASRTWTLSSRYERMSPGTRRSRSPPGGGADLPVIQPLLRSSSTFPANLRSGHPQSGESLQPQDRNSRTNSRSWAGGTIQELEVDPGGDRLQESPVEYLVGDPEPRGSREFPCPRNLAGPRSLLFTGAVRRSRPGLHRLLHGLHFHQPVIKEGGRLDIVLQVLGAAWSAAMTAAAMDPARRAPRPCPRRRTPGPS